MRAGLGNHKKSCKKKLEAAARESQFLADLHAEPQCTFYTLDTDGHLITVDLGSIPAPRFIAPWEMGARPGGSSVDDMLGGAR